MVKNSSFKIKVDISTRVVMDELVKYNEKYKSLADLSRKAIKYYLKEKHNIELKTFSFLTHSNSVTKEILIDFFLSFPDSQFPVPEIIRKFGGTRRNLHSTCRKLKEMGYLTSEKIRVEIPTMPKRKTSVYSFNKFTVPEIPKDHPRGKFKHAEILKFVKQNKEGVNMIKIQRAFGVDNKNGSIPRMIAKMCKLRLITKTSEFRRHNQKVVTRLITYQLDKTHPKVKLWMNLRPLTQGQTDMINEIKDKCGLGDWIVPRKQIKKGKMKTLHRFVDLGFIDMKMNNGNVTIAYIGQNSFIHSRRSLKVE